MDSWCSNARCQLVGDGEESEGVTTAARMIGGDQAAGTIELHDTGRATLHCETVGRCLQQQNQWSKEEAIICHHVIISWHCSVDSISRRRRRRRTLLSEKKAKTVVLEDMIELISGHLTTVFMFIQTTDISRQSVFTAQHALPSASLLRTTHPAIPSPSRPMQAPLYHTSQ